MKFEDYYSFEPGPLLWILAAFALGWLIQLGIYLFRYLPLALKKSSEPLEDWPAVSVVICARNEEENLQEHLPQILAQDYPDFEVVVVNDCSWDNTHDLLEDMKKRFSKLRVAEIREVENREHGKKFALTMGIKKASNEILLLTDADCVPLSDQWIRNMVKMYRNEKYLVLGYGKYMAEPGFVNQLIRFDTFQIGLNYLGMALRGNPYMGVGRNLSYHKALFFAVKGFASHMHIASGDDDLFVSEVAKSNNTAVMIESESVTVSKAPPTWSAWMKQKKRHQSTGKYYRAKHKFLLLLEPVSYYFMFIAAVASIVIQYNLLIILSALFLRACYQIGILHSIAKKLSEKDMGWKFPLLEIIHKFILLPIFAFYTLFVKKPKWS
jgi:cellulose synthase/poly-beta-1,6-N-acetylglucosamine synthase-like glycosyltransferase